ELQGSFLTENYEGNKDGFRSGLIAEDLHCLRFLLFSPFVPIRDIRGIRGFLKTPNFPRYIAPDFLQYLSEDPNRRNQTRKETWFMKKIIPKAIATLDPHQKFTSPVVAGFLVPLLLVCFALFVATSTSALTAQGAALALNPAIGPPTSLVKAR